MNHFDTYEEWHEAVTQRCGIVLTKDYCQERLRALGDLQDPATKAFHAFYGEAYLNQVVSWFRRAVG